MIIPVIEVKTKKSHVETKPVKAKLISSLSRITSLNIKLEFIQSDPVTNINKEATYEFYFVSEDNEKISNEVIYKADNKEIDSINRLFKLGFILKNMYYDSRKKYYFVAYNKDELEVFKYEVMIDLMFVDDFDF